MAGRRRTFPAAALATLILTRGFHSAPIVDPLILNGVERWGWARCCSDAFVHCKRSRRGLDALLCHHSFDRLQTARYRPSAERFGAQSHAQGFGYSLSVLSAGFFCMCTCHICEDEESHRGRCTWLCFCAADSDGLVLFSAASSPRWDFGPRCRARGRRSRRFSRRPDFWLWGALFSSDAALSVGTTLDLRTLSSPGFGLVRFGRDTYHLSHFAARCWRLLLCACVFHSFAPLAPLSAVCSLRRSLLLPLRAFRAPASVLLRCVCRIGFSVSRTVAGRRPSFSRSRHVVVSGGASPPADPMLWTFACLRTCRPRLDRRAVLFFQRGVAVDFY